MSTCRDRGSVTAELALALPTLVLVVVLGVQVLSALALSSRSQDAARTAARQLARGEDPVDVRSRLLAALPADSRFETSWSDGPSGTAGTRIVTAEVRVPLPVPAPLAFALGPREATGRATALEEGVSFAASEVPAPGGDDGAVG